MHQQNVKKTTFVNEMHEWNVNETFFFQQKTHQIMLMLSSEMLIKYVRILDSEEANLLTIPPEPGVRSSRPPPPHAGPVSDLSLGFRPSWTLPGYYHYLDTDTSAGTDAPCVFSWCRSLWYCSGITIAPLGFSVMTMSFYLIKKKQRININISFSSDKTTTHQYHY